MPSDPVSPAAVARVAANLLYEVAAWCDDFHVDTTFNVEDMIDALDGRLASLAEKLNRAAAQLEAAPVPDRYEPMVEARALLGQQVEVVLDRAIPEAVIRGQLLTVETSGEVVIRTEDGFTAYAWPMLEIRAAGVAAVPAEPQPEAHKVTADDLLGIFEHEDWCRYHDKLGCASQPRMEPNYNPRTGEVVR